MFDAEAESLNSFVYMIMESLPESIKLVLANPKHKPAKLKFSQEFFQGMASAVTDKWEKHRKPVNDAGFFLCHAHRRSVVELHAEDRVEFERVFKSTLAVIVQLFCRWAPGATATREVLLSAEHPDAVLFARDVKAGLQEMFLNRGDWAGFEWPEDAAAIDPETFWSMEAPVGCIFSMYAVMICCLDPSSCSVERLHQMMKQFRTKRRARLLYRHEHGLCFAKTSMLEEEKAAKPPSHTWKEIMTMFDKLQRVSSCEESWLGDLEAAWERANVDKVADEDEDATFEVESAPTPIASLLPMAAGPAGDVTVESSAPLRSSRRVRAEKKFEDFVRFDDDR
jgi:hypothetical protein